MAINTDDGKLGLDCWKEAQTSGTANAEQSLFSEDRKELREEAMKLLKDGMYRRVILYQWDARRSAWVGLEELTTKDPDAAAVSPPIEDLNSQNDE